MYTHQINRELSWMKKSKRCVLLGVSKESKAYKLFNPVSQKIIISKDVIFEEEKG